MESITLSESALAAPETTPIAPIPLVDNHCHALYRSALIETREQFRASFTEEPKLARSTGIIETTLHYRWSINQLAAHLGCAPDERSVIEARTAFELPELTVSYLRDAGVEWMLIDDGFPGDDRSRSMEDLVADAGARVAKLVRIETLAERLIPRCADIVQLEAALADALETAIDEGAVGFKSVAAYRTGLAISRHEEADVTRALEAARREDPVRVDRKPLVDHLVYTALEVAQRCRCPVQFHTGYGDSDADFSACDPFLLQETILQFPGVQFVLLHGAYPFTRHGAVLTATHPNVYLDLSYFVPFLARNELERMTAAALGSAPTSRLLYSSDGFGIPEHYWLGAVRGREILATCLEHQIEDGVLSPGETDEDLRMILHDNAVRLYALDTLAAR